MEFKELSIDEIEPNEWNPNEMDEVAFQRLIKEIKEVGFINPIQVVPVGDKYRIIGGEHRYRAALILGMEKIPAIILEDKKFSDEELQKFLTVRLNMLRGKLNPMKFMELYDEFAKKYGEDKVQELMAITDKEVWKKITKDLKKDLKKAGVPKEEIEKLDELDIEDIDKLGNILQDLFIKYGDTLKYSFMVFDFGGQKHVYIKLNKEAKQKLYALMDFCKDNQLNINAVLNYILEHTNTDELKEAKELMDEDNDVEYLEGVDLND